MLNCSICEKEALYLCSECKQAGYCSREHQIEHWEKGHKSSCRNIKINAQDHIQKILEIRKNYYENFSLKRIEECLLDAKVLIGLERKRLLNDSCISNELDYGCTICLLVKTYVMMRDKKGAKTEMEAYLTDRNSFLMGLKEAPPGGAKELKEKLADQLPKKLNLIACIANLSFAIGLECIHYYVLYTKIIILFFGADSYEASNCYFLVGCYFAEEGFFKKAIQCFKKAATIRGAQAGDCLYNIGVLYKMQNQLPKAQEMLKSAFTLREAENGNNDEKVILVHEMLGVIFGEMNDFKAALKEFQNAYNLRKNVDKNEKNGETSESYKNLIGLIQELYRKLSCFIDEGQPKIKRQEIYQQVKRDIEFEKAYWIDQEKHKKKNKDNQDNPNERATDLVADKKSQVEVKARFEVMLTLTQDFNNKLTLTELYRLSELQLELEQCTTIFGYIYAIGSSPFYESLSREKFEELESKNKKLFEMIKLENIKGIKQSVK